ncbi:gamma-glutamyltransferase family protein [Oscillatoria sp. FACHB-1406]|uniref:gamma-glutamyltransferase family protein n=1 Tax=Oscillatoria sp. FACHB-1406 TaxID=2692846 RepID=UPI001682D648|nr:gamma-glutamyltransferase family protein [Oscillatoria sp. FACHB-1406]MBD2580655.1 gamma-glutamyltransferase family protein [Oscillatoria sp. FACHB-1406]
MNFPSLFDYPYSSTRRVILGSRGAIATSQPLAATAGMEMLLKGGNAVDAAVASAIALTVVEPTSNGIGSDAFAIVWDGKELQGLNASGRSPKHLERTDFLWKERIPGLGWQSVTVPGAVSAWGKLWERWGSLPFEELFAPAIRYAEEGFPISPMTAQAWKRAEKTYLPLTEPEFQPFKEVFFPGDRAPEVGELWGSPLHARTLRAIASAGEETFYRGEIAGAIADFAAATGGYLSREDLAVHTAEWVRPISTTYRGLTVWEMPPNTQGIATLLALNILEGFELGNFPRESVESLHLQIEAMKLAFADLNRYIADPNFLEFPIEQLLDKSYAAQRRQLLKLQAINNAEPGIPDGGTVYLCTADRDMMVSFIQSNFSGFGSGILVPGTGIALQNRASGFTLAAGHPNQYAPGKRPFHTIIPGFLTQDGEPLGPFGVMGGQMQPQGHLQMAVNLVDYGLNPQAALDAPRWRFLTRDRVLLESRVPGQLASALAERGHNVGITANVSEFGKGQMILRWGKALVAATESRADGCAIVF